MSTTGGDKGDSRRRRQPLEALLWELGRRLAVEVIISLARAPKSVSELASEFNCTVDHVSHRLHELTETGLVEYENVGPAHVYRLSPSIEVTTENRMLTVRFRAAREAQLSLTFPRGDRPFSSESYWGRGTSRHSTIPKPSP